MKIISTFLLIFSLLVLLNSCDGADENPSPPKQKSEWIRNAFASLETDDYPRIKAISWWHENFDESLLKVNSSTKSLEAYKSGIESSTFISTADFVSDKLLIPSAGIYHAAYPNFGGTEDQVSTQRIFDFENLTGKEIAWAYFSNNWNDAIQFPKVQVKVIEVAGKTPFIRMMPRTNFDEGGPDPRYTMQNILEGKFDTELTQWAVEAANTGIPLLVEFGTEVNGNWFPWNGQYNGGAESTQYGDPTLPDGPERFRDAYRHIIDICKDNGATNITWFFHVDAYSEPKVSWNSFEQYYPGDNYIDWLGLSIYGPQKKEGDYQEFSEILNGIYPAMTSLSDKPIAILEFAITELD